MERLVGGFMADDPFQLQPGIVALWETRKDDAEAFFVSDISQPFHSLHYAEVAFQTALLSESPESEKEAMKRLAEAEVLLTDRVGAQSSWVQVSLSP
jgi:hypothetical protein